MQKLTVIIACITLLACEQEQVGQTPTSIRVAVLPDQSADALLSRHTPLLDYLDQETPYEFELSIPRDYEDLLEQFDAGNVDLAWFGGLTFVQAERQSRAMPIAFRDVDLQFTSCYLADASDSRSSILDYEGEAFGFGPRLSTSGHLMPRHYLAAQELEPERFFASVQHAAGHDQTARWVADGTIALGVVNCVIVKSMFDNGQLQSDEVRIIETTPPYSDYVWAVQGSMDESVQTAILNALLALDATIPAHREILRLQGANTYLPAGSDDFEIIRRAAEQASVLAEDGAS